MSIEQITMSRDQIARAELALDIINRARAMVSARMYDIEVEDPDSAQALRHKRFGLLSIQQRVRVEDSDFVEGVIAQWGKRINDDAVFWEEL